MTDKLPWMCNAIDCQSPRMGTLELCATHAKLHRDEDRNASKPVKVAKPIKKIGNKNVWWDSNGDTYSEQSVRNRLTACIQAMDEDRIAHGYSVSHCDAYNQTGMVCDHDHTISKQRCKELGKTELVWDSSNIEYSSRKAHMEWEGYKSGEFCKHKNLARRMAFLKEHDYESFIKRSEVLELFNQPEHAI
jgi:hypothetical protein